MVNYLKQCYYWLCLVLDYSFNLTLKEYREWQLNDDKPLKLVIIEWSFNFIAKYFVFGLLFSYGLRNCDTFTGLWLLVSISLWLLFKVLWLIRNGEQS